MVKLAAHSRFGTSVPVCVQARPRGCLGTEAIMKEYETVWEIFNLCPNNQMRDVFFDEIETDDPEEFIKNKFKDKEFSYDKTVMEDGTIVFDILTAGIRQRYTFTEV